MRAAGSGSRRLRNMDGERSGARWPASRVVPAALATAFVLGCAALGYAIAILPIWYQAHKLHETETLGRVVKLAELRSKPLDAYLPDSGVDAAALDDFAWVTPLTMTPFVGVGPAPGTWNNAHIDFHQFRGTRQMTTPKPAGVTRIFLTGASVAFGSGAPSDDRTIGAYLQRFLERQTAETGRRYEVFTFATAAWSSTHERIAIENRISDLEPDLVVSLTGAGDLIFAEWGSNVLWARSRTDQYYWFLVNVAMKRAGFDYMTDVADVVPRAVPPEVFASRLKKNFDLAALALSGVNARLHVFFQPSVVTTRKHLGKSERRISKGLTYAPGGGLRIDFHTACREQLRTAFRKEALPANVSFTDLTEVFDEVPESETVFLDAFHVADRGNSIIAEAIGRALESSSSSKPTTSTAEVSRH